MKVLDTNHFLDVCLTEVKQELEESEEKVFDRYPIHDEKELKLDPDSINTFEKTPIILMEPEDETEGVKLEPTFVDVDHQSGIQIYNCPECDYKSQVKYYLIKHIKRCHKSLCETNMHFICPYCRSQFQGLASYHKHCLDEHSEKLPKVTCNICLKELASTKSLLIHKKVAHEMYRINCTQCEKVVTSKQGLLQHIQKDHSVENPTQDIDISETPFSVDDESRKQYKCSGCDYSSPIKQNIKKHEKAAHGDDLSLGKELLPCPSCDKTFLGVPNLHRHAKEEHDLVLKLDHSCKECGKEFNKKSNLQTHIRSVHEGIRYQCDFCEKELSTLGNKTLHLKKFHPEKVSSDFTTEKSSVDDALNQNQQYLDCSSFDESDSVDNNEFTMQESINSTDTTFTNQLHSPSSSNAESCKTLSTAMEYYDVEKFRVGDNLNYLYKCEFCNTTCDKRWIFRRHLQRVHKVIAKNPNKLNTEGNATQDSKPFCGLCSINFENRTLLKQHNLSSHGTPRSIHYCKLCDRTYDSKRSLHKHLYKFHYDEEPEDNSCIFCSQVMESVEELRKHKAIHQSIFVNCEFCGASFDHTETMNGHIRNVHFYCNLCKVQFNDKDEIILHIAELHSNLEFPCNLCGKTFLSKAACKLHIESFHERLKKYECSYCDYKTNNQSTLKCHVEGMHIESKEYFCDQCDFKTSWENYLKLHKKAQHLGVIFHCPHCEYKSKYKLNVKNHVRGVHSDERHTCHQCGKEFRWLQALKQHIERVHEGLVFTCPLCEYEAKRKDRLDKHMTKKHGVTFSCSNCSFSTVKKKLYVDHKRRCRKEVFETAQTIQLSSGDDEDPAAKLETVLSVPKDTEGLDMDVTEEAWW